MIRSIKRNLLIKEIIDPIYLHHYTFCMNFRTFIKKAVTFILLSSIISNAWAISKEAKYDELMKNGDAAEIVKAFKKDNTMSQAKIGTEKDSLIMRAIKYDRTESIIKLLLRGDVKINAKNKNKQTALMYACIFSKDSAVIKLVVSKSGSGKKLQKLVQEKDKDGKSALNYATENPDQTAFNIISKYVQKTEESQEEEPVQKSNPVIVLEKEPEAPAIPETEPEVEVDEPEADIKADFDENEIDFETEISEEPATTVEVPAETAPAVETTQITEEPETPVAEEPVSSSPSVNKYDKTYLYDFIAIEEDPEPEAEPETQGLAYIENPDAKDKNGRTALMLAVKDGNDWEIKSLLYSKADVNLKDKDDWTALMYAVRYQNSLEIVNLLLDNGANAAAKNKFGATPLQIAATYTSNPDILKKLINSSSPNSEELFKAFILSITSSNSNALTQVTKIKIFIERGIAINRFYDGKTPLMYAAEYASSTDILKVLLDNGAVTGVRTSDGKTAFSFAESNKHLEHNNIYWSLNGR